MWYARGPVGLARSACVAPRASPSALRRPRKTRERRSTTTSSPIKLTADQARIAALAFEVLYEKDPVEDLEEMLKDKERPGLRLKLQQAIEGALALPLVSSAASSFLDDSR